MTGITIIWDLDDDEEGNVQHIAVIYEQIDEDTVYPVTAFEVPEPS